MNFYEFMNLRNYEILESGFFLADARGAKSSQVTNVIKRFKMIKNGSCCYCKKHALKV